MSDRDTSKDYRVRNDELRPLVEKWRAHEHQPVYQRAANELEALINDA